MAEISTVDSSVRRQRAELFLATFGILALELAIIRWMSQQIRVFAYLNNVILIGAFLGMGLGVALGRRRPGLVHATLPVLLLLAVLLAFSSRIGLLHLGFPDTSVAMWGIYPAAHFGLALLQIMGLFTLVVAVFVCAGAPVGAIFARIDSLEAYAADLAGSAAGVLAMTLLSAARTPPWVWFLLGGVPFIVLSRKWWSVLSLAAVVGLAWNSGREALFSPYYRIDIFRNDRVAGGPMQLSVNRDFHQYMLDLSPARVTDPALDQGTRRRLAHADRAYRLPFEITRRRDRALVLGAGTGNDVAAALKSGFTSVVAVDIDPVIIATGRRLHPEKPYSDPRVQAVVNDARAYLEQNRDEPFDVVCFGLLDSHAMFSAMATLRLDNYVYTVEGLRQAWERVRPGGVLSVSFSVGEREWLSDRLRQVLFEATGQAPTVIFHGVQGGRSFIVSKNGAAPIQVSQPAAGEGSFFPIQQLPPRDTDIRPSTDDWPFLYLKPDTIPWGYLSVLFGVAIFSLLATRAVFSRNDVGSSTISLAMFFMGAAFLLVETRGVTTLSLLFGSTWLVNSAVFFGILITVWVANWYVRRRPPRRVEPYFVFLGVALLLNYAVPLASLLQMPLLARWVLGGVLNALPVGAAGIVFSSLLRRAEAPDRALGANLLGAVFGGCLEYVSIVTGLRALTLLALVLYLVALLFLIRSRSETRTAVTVSV
jgi:spermidine synthase